MGLPVKSVMVDNALAWDSDVIVTRRELSGRLLKETCQLIFGVITYRGECCQSKGLWRRARKKDPTWLG